eukprot:9484630-Pyramimonas_sp.AAC.1
MIAEQILRMSQARRGSQQPQGGAARGYCTPVARKLRGRLEWFACSNIFRCQSRLGGCLERGDHFPPQVGPDFEEVWMS